MATHYQGTDTEILALDLYIKLARAADTVSQRINRHLAGENLTISQFGVLEALYHLGPLQPSQLAQKILKSTGNMTLVVENLVQRGLVQRSRRPTDRRCIDVYLTAEGQALIQRIFPSHAKGVVETMSVLSNQEQEELAALCRKLGSQKAG